MRKVVVLGASQCGKTSLVRRLVDGTFCATEQPTMGVDLVILGQQTQLWDTSGQPRYSASVATHLCGAHAVLLCYSVTSAASFAQARDYWLPQLHATSDATICLAGTHLKLAMDAPAMRQVSAQEVASVMAQWSSIAQWSECDAKHDLGMAHIREWIEGVPALAQGAPPFGVSMDAEQEPSPRALLKPHIDSGASTRLGCCWRGGAVANDDGSDEPVRIKL